MTSEFHTKKLKTFKTMSESWKNAPAKIWEYQVSHAKLVIRIEENSRKGNLHVICLGPLFIHGPAKWENSNLTADIIEDNNCVIYKIADKGADFFVTCEALEIKENCKPIF